MKDRRNYSDSIANVIRNFLNEDGWHFTFDEKKGIFRFGLGLKGKIKKINYIVDVMDDDYIVYAISPLGADEDDEKMMAAMYEYVCRANSGLKMGNFELDPDGEIRFKVHICCENITPSAEMVKRSIYCPATMIENYGSGITDVIFTGATAKEAIEKCEQSREEMMRSFISKIVGDDDIEDTDALMARLDALFGDDDESDEDSIQEECESEEIDINTDLFESDGGDL